MSARTYPYKAWTLQPSFKPVEVELVKPYSDYGLYLRFDCTSKGKPYSISELHPTKEAAIAAGREKVKEQQADLAKRQERLNKRIAALDKAEQA